MLRVDTEFSRYEIDPISNTARHIPDGLSPSPRFQPSGDWKPYESAVVFRKDSPEALDLVQVDYGDVIWFAWSYSERLRGNTELGPVTGLEWITDEQETMP